MVQLPEKFLYERIINKNCDLNMWFVFPGTESFALSSLGYLWLYRSIDMLDNVNIERVCSDTSYTNIMPERLDLIGFSFTFDMDFIQIFSILEKYNFEFKAAQRPESAPLIFAGGPVVTANPKPYKDIFDFMIIGDGEDLNLEAVKLCIDNKQLSKFEKLKLLSEIDGIYVPLFNNDVKKITKMLTQCIYTPIISEKAFFKNTFILELERGCANRCGFCLASYMNMPIRFVDYDKIIDTIDFGLKYTNKIALLGAQITAHPDFNKVCKYIYDKIKNGENIEMGISSLRVDSFTPEIVETLTAAGQKNLTLAIEAGSERLRRVINKHLSEDQIFKAIDVAYNTGLRGIKFYGMIGLPTETMQDIEEIVNLSRRIKKQYKNFDISFGFSTFVPKANTPFQWIGRNDEKSLEKKSIYLKKELNKLGIQTVVSSAKWDYWQAVLSRGDEKLIDFLIRVYKYGAKLGAFKKAAKELNIDTDYYALDTYSYEKDLPWDFIDTMPGKEFLINECERLIYS